MEDLEILDLSDKKLKKLNKPSPQETQISTLILDDNELQRLDNVDSFTRVQKLSAVRNQLLRMYGVCRLQSLRTLNLAHNGILTIEGLKELVHLKHLCLAGNNIKTIEHLNTNINLEHLDLSENCITNITDLSFLKNLQELLLHNNKLNHLHQCDRFLPCSLVTLTLANNNINDLNEISQLVHLTALNSISLVNNPCVSFSGNSVGFDYRPFVINWCMSVRVIDGYVVDAIESLRAEWLYSQGRGRHFRVGDQQELVQYLATVCPLTGEALETEENRKLRLILSKAQHHQQQLRDQQSNGETPVPSPLSRKKFHSARNSPRTTVSRLGGKKSPDRMSSSCYGPSSVSDGSPIMTQSLDPNMFSQSISSKISSNSSRNVSNGDIIERCLEDVEPINSPLQALSKLVPVPESLMSPDYRPSLFAGRVNTPSTIPTPVGNKAIPKVTQSNRSPKTNRAVSQKPKSKLQMDSKKSNSPTPPRQRKQYESKESHQKVPYASILRKSNSSEDESEICDSKLQTIQMKVEKCRLQKDMESEYGGDKERMEKAAVCIQKLWRGYSVRNRDKKVQDIFRTLQAQRADQYIQKLATDMESTKAALESERKIQMLQMQAINALWKKVSTLQVDGGGLNNPFSLASGDNAEIVKDLAQTCSLLQSQIQQLQGSMQDIIKFMTIFSQTTPVMRHFNENGIATQTEISAVHTPQGDGAKVFPFQKQTRPSSLPLPVNQRNKKDEKQQATSTQELRQFAGSLVDGVIKTVSETKADCFGLDTTEITITDTDKGSNLSITNEAVDV